MNVNIHSDPDINSVKIESGENKTLEDRPTTSTLEESKTKQEGTLAQRGVLYHSVSFPEKNEKLTAATQPILQAKTEEPKEPMIKASSVPSGLNIDRIKQHAPLPTDDDDDVLFEEKKTTITKQSSNDSNQVSNTHVQQVQSDSNKDVSASIGSKDAPVVVQPPLSAPIVPAVVAPAPIDLSKLQQINDLIEKADPNHSAQAILSNVIKGLSQLYPGKEIIIDSELTKKEGRFETELFTIPGQAAPSYKIGVTYTVKVDGENLVIPSLKREIFTSAKTPEGALVAAFDFKKMIVDIAVSDATNKDDKRQLVSDYTTFPAQQKKEILEQKSFHFKYELDAANRPTSLSSIYGIGTNIKSPLQFKIEPEPKTSQYEYKLDFEKNIVTRQAKADRSQKGGAAVSYYATEKEALLHVRYMVKNDNLYLRLEQSSNINEEINLVKKELHKQELEFEEIKAAFKKEPIFKLFGKAKTTKEFKQYVAGLNLDLSQNFQIKQEKELSPSMIAFLKMEQKKKTFLNQYKSSHKGERQLKEELANLKEIKDQSRVPTKEEIELMQNIAAEHKIKIDLQAPQNSLDSLIDAKKDEMDALATIEADLKQIQTEIAKEQSYFNERLSQLQKAHKDLETKIEQIKQTREAADRKLAASGVKDDKAVAIQKAFSDKEIKNWEEILKVNQATIITILKRLDAVGAKKSTEQADILVGESNQLV